MKYGGLSLLLLEIDIKKGMAILTTVIDFADEEVISHLRIALRHRTLLQDVQEAPWPGKKNTVERF
jgi:hypothetical protein